VSGTEPKLGTTHLALGVLGRPHGVRGELVFRLHNPAGVRPEQLRLPLPVQLRSRDGASRPAEIVFARAFGGEGSLIRLAGVTDRDVAARFTNSEVLVPRTRLPPLGPGEYYVADLIGCQVQDVDGRDRGVVHQAYWNGSQDILEIKDQAGNELLIPAAGDFLREVDLAARRLVIDDHQGDEAAAGEPGPDEQDDQ
jgi:16S rRNA processing protein RimM